MPIAGACGPMCTLMSRKPFNPELVKMPKDSPGGRKNRMVTVSQVTALVRRVLEDALPTTLHVVGEISNFKRHSSGHLYFTLKDDRSELSCVTWRSDAAKLKFQPADGLEVIVTGRIEVFERAGRYQLYARRLEPRGVGALELAFRQLQEKLATEGLFDERRKKSLPAFPKRLALVTSPTGAAIADMIDTLRRRFPCLTILVYPVRVQGEGAAREIAHAINRINAQYTGAKSIDVMIVGRGGGSLEDLWAFNEEVVARAIYASDIPIISAVGHEVDVSIADLVADVRAATPTAAAELAVPVLDDLLAAISVLNARLHRAIASHADMARVRLNSLLARTAFREPLTPIRRHDQTLDELSHRMYRKLAQRLVDSRRALESKMPAVERIAPHRYLLRTSSALHDAQQRLRSVMSERMRSLERRLGIASDRIARGSPLHTVETLSERVNRVSRALRASMRHRLAIVQSRLQAGQSRLTAVSHKGVLARGFSVTRIKKGRTVVRSAGALRDGMRIITETADGAFESEVLNHNQMELFE